MAIRKADIPNLKELQARRDELTKELAEVNNKLHAASPPAQGPGQIAGFLAPIITPEKLTRYREIIAQVRHPETRSVLKTFCDAVQKYLDIKGNINTRQDGMDPFGRGPLMRFDAQTIEDLDPTTPWPREVTAYKALLETMPESNQDDFDTKAVAHHLLWYVNELAMDREPPTRDRALSAEQIQKQNAAQEKLLGFRLSTLED